MIGAEGLAGALYTYGGWGVAAVCIIAIWRMAAYITKTHEAQHATDKETAVAQREETRATVTALVETRETLRAFKEAMEALARKLDDYDAR